MSSTQSLHTEVGVHFRLLGSRKELHRTTVRDECLNENWFRDLAEARAKIAERQQDSNEKRPHSSFQHRTPVEFAGQAASFYKAGLGQESSNAGPLPQTPIPPLRCGANKTGESLIISGLELGGRSNRCLMLTELGYRRSIGQMTRQ
jgi:hypothetical protein